MPSCKIALFILQFLVAVSRVYLFTSINIKDLKYVELFM